MLFFAENSQLSGPRAATGRVAPANESLWSCRHQRDCRQCDKQVWYIRMLNENEVRNMLIKWAVIIFNFSVLWRSHIRSVNLYNYLFGTGILNCFLIFPVFLFFRKFVQFISYLNCFLFFPYEWYW